MKQSQDRNLKILTHKNRFNGVLIKDSSVYERIQKIQSITKCAPEKQIRVKEAYHETSNQLFNLPLLKKIENSHLNGLRKSFPSHKCEMRVPQRCYNKVLYLWQEKQNMLTPFLPHLKQHFLSFSCSCLWSSHALSLLPSLFFYDKTCWLLFFLALNKNSFPSHVLPYDSHIFSLALALPFIFF